MLQPLLYLTPAGGQPAGALLGYPGPAKEVEVLLALRTSPLAAATLAALHGVVAPAPGQRRYLTHAEVAAATGAPAEAASALEAYFLPFAVLIKDRSLLLGLLTLTGRVADLERALGTSIATFQVAGRPPTLATTSACQLPPALLALLSPDQPAPAVRKEHRPPGRPLPPPAGLAGPPRGHSPQALGRAYQLPADATGEGQVVGLVELGSKLNQQDLKQFFAESGLKKPRISEVGAAALGPGSGGQLLATAQVALDIQVAGALAPQARFVVYYGTTLAEALQAAVRDEVHRPTVLAMSWVAPEACYSPAEVQQLNLLLCQASLLGIALVAASGDYGAYHDFKRPGTSPAPGVALPAAHPLVLGCGGTAAPFADGQLTDERVWNDLAPDAGSEPGATGGGYSSRYPQPFYQRQALAQYPYQPAATRGVPDVGAYAGPEGYRVVLGGQPHVLGGTGGAAAFWAALLALLGEKLGHRLGSLHAALYAFAGSEAFRPVTQGHNQRYPAAAGWNPCTGLGSPVGTGLLHLLRQLEQASTPLPAAPPPGPELPTGPPPAGPVPAEP